METMNPDPDHKLLYVKTKETTLKERGKSLRSSPQVLVAESGESPGG